jgi:2-dehydro-3-deoxyphosphooctonate aldolase (KDO 8-P synthase)
MTATAAPKPVNVGDLAVGPHQLTLIAGPCVIESRDHCLKLAEFARELTRRLEIGYVFKASFDKANRTSVTSYRGPGLETGLKILGEVRRQIGVPVTTDIHEANQAAAAAEVVDLVQLPAFLCRQTDLLLAAGKTGKPINIKKGQFMAPEQMATAVEKIRTTGNQQVLLTERGTFFGYHRLVNDMTSIPRMRALGCPVVFDATHSCQQPGAAGHQTGGQREFVPTLGCSALAAGADALFLEIHDQPDKALSDPATSWPLDTFEMLLRSCLAVWRAVHV